MTASRERAEAFFVQEPLRNKTYYVANRVWTASDIPQALPVINSESDQDLRLHAHHGKLFDSATEHFHDIFSHVKDLIKPADYVSEKEAGVVIAGRISSALEEGKLVVIDNRASAEVVGMRKTETGGIEVFRTIRASGEEFQRTVSNVKVEAQFFQKDDKKEFVIRLLGSENNQNGEAKARRKKTLEIKSDGNVGLPSFTVVASRKDSLGKRVEEVIVGRQDKEGSLTGAYHYRGDTRWIIDCKDKYDVIKAHRARIRR